MALKQRPQRRSEHVHRLGNLTITGYNSNLSNKSFDEKKNRKDAAGRAIGYANGLSLNNELMTTHTWNAPQDRSPDRGIGRSGGDTLRLA